MSETVFPLSIKPPLMFFIPLAAGILLHVFLQPLRFFPGNFSNVVIGGATIVFAIVLGFHARKAMESHGVSPKFKPVKKVVQSGPYYFSRNPLYITLILLYTGISIAANTLWPLVLIPIPIAYLYYRVIRLEEAYLEKEFGEEYQKYKRKVRRWV